MKENQIVVAEKNGQTMLKRVGLGLTSLAMAGQAFAIDTTAVTGTITSATGDVETVGVAILAVIIAVVAFSWISSVMKRT